MIALLGAVAITGASAAFGPIDAEAVTGVITYHIRQGNRMYRIEDPGDDHCYGVGDGYGEVDNDTPTDLVLYNGRDCTGSVVTVVRSGSWLNARFGSLRLSADGPRYPQEPEPSDNPDDADSPAPSDNPDGPGNSDSHGNSDGPGNSDGSGNSDSPDQSAGPERPADPVNAADPVNPRGQRSPESPARRGTAG
ncbi:chitin-binding protein [Streptomyces sp. NPDC054765]